jgi:hypothetical protein
VTVAVPLLEDDEAAEDDDVPEEEEDAVDPLEEEDAVDPLEEEDDDAGPAPVALVLVLEGEPPVDGVVAPLLLTPQAVSTWVPKPPTPMLIA